MENHRCFWRSVVFGRFWVVEVIVIIIVIVMVVVVIIIIVFVTVILVDIAAALYPPLPRQR